MTAQQDRFADYRVQQPHCCTRTRTFKVRLFEGFDAFEKETTDAEEWITGPCNAPLFSDEDERTGTCRSCRSGWETAENFPAPEFVRYVHLCATEADARAAVARDMPDCEITYLEPVGDNKGKWRVVLWRVVLRKLGKEG